jgi:pimeloyl-ACP methyl ester carboxylesterase
VRSMPVTFAAPSSPARPLAGLLHPGGERGVLLCPPLGREHLLSYAQFRSLADDLQATGLTVLRFDYDGTGDSDGGMGDPDRLEAWLLSIEAAAGYLRGLGVTSLSLVGLRIGALLAVRAAERLPDLDGLVLWDPQTSGKAFLREQTFLAGLASAGVTRVNDGSVHAFGTVFPPAAAEQVSTLKLTPAPWPVAKRLLVVNRPTEHLPAALLTSLAPEHERFESSEQAGLLESDPPRPAPDTAAAIVRWFAGPGTPALPVPRARVEVPLRPAVRSGHRTLARCRRARRPGCRAAAGWHVAPHRARQALGRPGARVRGRRRPRAAPERVRAR